MESSNLGCIHQFQRSNGDTTRTCLRCGARLVQQIIEVYEAYHVHPVKMEKVLWVEELH